MNAFRLKKKSILSVKSFSSLKFCNFRKTVILRCIYYSKLPQKGNRNSVPISKKEIKFKIFFSASRRHFFYFKKSCNWQLEKISVKTLKIISPWPHFGTWILLLGPFGQLRTVILVSLSYFRACLFQLFMGKKYCSVHTEKLHNISFASIFFRFFFLNFLAQNRLLLRIQIMSVKERVAL